LSYTIFPRTEYVDGEFSNEEIDRLEKALALYMAQDPEGFNRSTQRVSGMKPKEYYEAFASACDQIVSMFSEEYVRGGAIPFNTFVSKLSRVWGSALVSWWQIKKVESVFKDLE
jgi:hypothetical protein